MKLGVIKGKDIDYSLSPAIFKEFGENYFEKALNRRELKTFLKKRDFDGINVTIPYKKECIKYLDEISPLAKEIGAVNTIVNKNGKLIGYNTDYFGLIESIKKEKISVKNKTAIILGGGGAAVCVVKVLKDLGAKETVTVTRKGEVNFANLNKLYPNAEIIINATPVGEFLEKDKSLIDLKDFNKAELFLDLIYRPFNTFTVLEARELKIKSMGGLYHLVSQAKKSAELFGLKNLPKIKTVYDKVLFDNRNIVLVGFAGAGKTSVGKELSKWLNKKLIDTDREIEKREKISINKIIKTKGEKYFRKIESEIVREVSREHGVIISTGGGVVLNRENVLNLKQNGVIIFIDRKLDEKEIKNRVLFLSKDVKAVYKERFPLYNNCCDFKVKNNRTIKDTVKRLIKKLK